MFTESCPPVFSLARHLISNMHSLVTIAPLVQAALGRRRFIILYLGGGAAASLTSILFNRVRPRRPCPVCHLLAVCLGHQLSTPDFPPHAQVMGRRKTGTLGASGAIFALLARCFKSLSLAVPTTHNWLCDGAPSLSQAANAMMFPELRYSWWGGAELTSGQARAGQSAAC